MPCAAAVFEMSTQPVSSILQSPLLQDQLLCVLRFRHYSLPTKEAYLRCVQFFGAEAAGGKMIGPHHETRLPTMNSIAASARESSATGQFDRKEGCCQPPNKRYQAHQSRQTAKTDHAHSMSLASQKRLGRRINSAGRALRCRGDVPENSGGKAHMTTPTRHAYRH